MERGPRVAVFDCDGTLVDSEEAHLASWRHTLQSRGYDLTPEQAVFFTGKAAPVIANLIAADIGCNDPEEIVAEKRKVCLLINDN